jgi:hypothetical protein
MCNLHHVLSNEHADLYIQHVNLSNYYDDMCRQHAIRLSKYRDDLCKQHVNLSKYNKTCANDMVTCQNVMMTCANVM